MSRTEPHPGASPSSSSGERGAKSDLTPAPTHYLGKCGAWLSSWRGSRHKKRNWLLIFTLSLILLLIIAGIAILNLKGDKTAPAQVPESELSLSSTLSERAQAMGSVKLNDRVVVGNLYIIDGSSVRGNLGLSGVANLNNSGMLFFYKDARPVNFWMKDMLINLDIIWLDCSGKVLGWQQDAKPVDYPKTYQSPKLNYVLEVESGFINQNQLKIGDKLELKFNDRNSDLRCRN